METLFPALKMLNGHKRATGDAGGLNFFQKGLSERHAVENILARNLSKRMKINL